MLYDIEYVLGGKLSNLQRTDLTHTTAAAEGLVDANRRQRRPASTFDNDDEVTTPAEDEQPPSVKGIIIKNVGMEKVVKRKPGRPPKNGGMEKEVKRKPGRPPGAKNKTSIRVEEDTSVMKVMNVSKDSSSSAVASKKRKLSSPKSTPSDDDKSNFLAIRKKAALAGWETRRANPAITANGIISKIISKPRAAGKRIVSNKHFKRSSTTDTSESEATSTIITNTHATATTATEDAMYAKHKREMEKARIRLEKLDRFGFFLEVVPTEFDENYDNDTHDEVVVVPNDGGCCDDGGGDNISGSNDAVITPVDEGSSIARSSQKCRLDVKCPDHPPFNFLVIRKRFAAGIYNTDMVALELKRLDEIKAVIDMSASTVSTMGNIDNTIEYAKLEKSFLHPIAVNWEKFNADVCGMCDAAIIRDPEGVSLGSGHLGWHAKKIKNVMEEMYSTWGYKRKLEVELSEARTKYEKMLMSCGNMEAAMQGKWRKHAFPERKYERLETTSVICDGLSPNDRSYAMYELETKLPDSFVGLAYTYDDSGQHSETWMKTVADQTSKPQKKAKKKKKEEGATDDAEVLALENEAKVQKAAMALAEDDGVVRAQVQTTMTTLLIQVQDRVMTDLGVMHNSEARSVNWDDGDHGRDYRGGGAEVEQGAHSGISRPEVAEQEVWGIDCYTRKNVMTLIESEFTPEIATEFVEKWLLPAINACPVDLAHKMSNAAILLEGLEFSATVERNSTVNDNEATFTTEQVDGASDEPFFPEPELAPPSMSVDPSTRMSDDPSPPSSEDSLMPASEYASSPSAPKDTSQSVFLRQALKTKIRKHAPSWIKLVARLVRLAVDSMDDDYFRIHPKGHGSVVIGEDGLNANSLVTYYRGEVYPAWRWCEKLDAIECMQKELNLRPNLPDFYNMAMERPKKDPRGYCLLFVDASRKSGLGSSFSHSCNPNCEVRVVSLNGKLSLSMTTLRDLELGEELTFDYNAVTESVNEYRFAICLCGQLNCRGSFLHYATADCYQQVLSRNSPIAARFANLVRGCMKQVMSKEDSELLLKHGFNTAAFGAVSFNHHMSSVDTQATPDSIENVPIWLRTFVADCLRYIEYERRALPVALLCNQMERMEKEQKQLKKARRKKVDDTGAVESAAPKLKSVAPSKPMSSYFYFLLSQRDVWDALTRKEHPDLKGLELSHAVGKVASQAWSKLSDEEKQIWRQKAIKEWKTNGGIHQTSKSKEDSTEFGKEVDETEQNDTPIDHGSNMEAKTISIAAADAEGFSAMEQRIQQLAQSLSRIGRVLDRHREIVFAEQKNGITAVSDLLRNLVQSPLEIMSDDEVVCWMWSDSKGVIPNLFSMIDMHFSEHTLLSRLLARTKKSYRILPVLINKIKAPLSRDFKLNCSSADARRLVQKALLKLRMDIIDYLSFAEKSYEAVRKSSRTKEEQKKREKNLSSDALTAILPEEVQPDTALEKSKLPFTCDDGDTLPTELMTAPASESVPVDGDEAMTLRGGGDECITTDQSNLAISMIDTANNFLLPPPTSAIIVQESSLDGAEKSTVFDDAQSLLLLSQVSGTFGQPSPATSNYESMDLNNVEAQEVDCTVSASKQHQPSAASASTVAFSAGWTEHKSPTGVPYYYNTVTKVSTYDRTMALAGSSTSSEIQDLIPTVVGNKNNGISAITTSHFTVTEGLTSGIVPLTLPDGVNQIIEPEFIPTKPKKIHVVLTEDQEKCLSNWLFDPTHLLNPYPTADEKNTMMKITGLDKSRIESWFVKSRRKLLNPVVEPMQMEWNDKEQEHWEKFRKHRFMLEATADLLLMYAHTTTFFRLKPFHQFDSTPIEVYARELGNEVPRHFSLQCQECTRPVPFVASSDGGVLNNSSAPTFELKESDNTEAPPEVINAVGLDELCSPDDVIKNVIVDYSGDYVLSQLLQWVNGGIGQKKGLPDIYGCVMLPPINGCWEEMICNEVKLPNHTKHNHNFATEYKAKVRPKLAKWFSDRYQRGSPWEHDIAKFFCPLGESAPDSTMPMGSPVLDYLVTGVDENIRHVSAALSGQSSTTVGGGSKMSASDRLQCTVDEGMPAQAVANWVQCENPTCLKWRKLPWHVDVDLLPETFFCKDNIWNPKSRNCDAHEDQWDMSDAPIKFDQDEEFNIGVWFDVQREGKVGYYEAQVVELDLESNIKRVKFHFWKLSSDRDEWVDIGSPRIAPHHSYTPRPIDGYVTKNMRNSDSANQPLSVIASSSTSVQSKKIDNVQNGDFTTSAKEHLSKWLARNANNPFASQDDLNQLSVGTGMSKKQVSDWLSNARKKLSKKSLAVKAENPKSGTTISNHHVAPLQDSLLQGSPSVPSVTSASTESLSPSESPNASSSATPNGLTEEAKTYLSQWLTEHSSKPYPSKEEKELMMRHLGITDVRKLEGWFTRARKRQLTIPNEISKFQRPIQSAQNTDPASTSETPNFLSLISAASIIKSEADHHMASTSEHSHRQTTSAQQHGFDRSLSNGSGQRSIKEQAILTTFQSLQSMEFRARASPIDHLPHQQMVEQLHSYHSSYRHPDVHHQHHQRASPPTEYNMRCSEYPEQHSDYSSYQYSEDQQRASHTNHQYSHDLQRRSASSPRNTDHLPYPNSPSQVRASNVMNVEYAFQHPQGQDYYQSGRSSSDLESHGQHLSYPPPEAPSRDEFSNGHHPPPTRQNEYSNGHHHPPHGDYYHQDGDDTHY